MRAFLLAVLLAVMPFCAQALPVDRPLPDAQMEARARALFSEIRCVVCQSESIADSPADVASDMRRAIRQRIASGESDQLIRDYLTRQYGNFILMKPPLMRSTLLLWFGPLLVLGIGGLMAWRVMRKHPAKADA